MKYLLIVHGERDRTVPFELAEELAKRCREVGLNHRFFPLAGRGHGFSAIPPTSRIQGRSLSQQVADFLKAATSK